MLPAGKSLRTLREKLGLTMRDVENSSARVADKYRNEEFSIPPSRLSDIETKGILPSIYRLYTMSVIYRRDLRELLSWYGVEMNNMAADLGLSVASKPESQDICFVPFKRYTEFIELYAPEILQPGPIVDQSGTVVGEHRGIALHTVGALGKPSPVRSVGSLGSHQSDHRRVDAND